MFAEYYHLSGSPFQLTPDSRFFFESSVHAKAMAHLTYGLHQGEGFIVITGDVGAGKTTLVEHLCAGLDKEKYVIVRLSSTQITADDTLRMVAAGFAIATEGLAKAEILQRLESVLVKHYEAGRRSLLIVDEAQNLSNAALEELRMLSNFCVGNVAPMQSFLLGQPQFRHALALPELEQLRQRVLASYHLGPLGAEETRAYIEYRLGRVGWRDDPHFTDDAFGALHRASGGIPRRINNLCSRAMLLGFLEDGHEITGGMVNEVAEELDAELGAGAMGSTTQLPREAAAPTGVEPSDIARRMARLEQRVEAQERAIKRVTAMAAAFIQGDSA